MKFSKALGWGLVALAAIGTGAAWADHRHGHGGVRFGVYVGPPYWGPFVYPPAFYYPPVVIERAPPPVYIEQSPPPVAAPAPTSYWYYCAASRAYYPYVNECPGGWMKVLPQPPAQP